LLAQCDGDWDRFYAAARIGDLPPAERDAALRKLAPPATEVKPLTALRATDAGSQTSATSQGQ
jgi:hypothetical protein